MKKIVRLVFWLSLMLLMIPLLGCSTATCSEKAAFLFRKAVRQWVACIVICRQKIKNSQ